MYWHRVKQLDMNPFTQPSQLPYHFTNEETQHREVSNCLRTHSYRKRQEKRQSVSRHPALNHKH